MKNDSLKLDMFFPDELLSTTSVNHDDSSIHIKMRSKTHSSKCPECGQETQIYHGTYLRAYCEAKRPSLRSKTAAFRF